ncbi:MAG: class I SAM-dependent methyltransferase [Anaerolineae bacterium]
MSIIQQDDIQYVQASFCSRGGRLFQWENELYRGLSPDLSPFYDQLFLDGLIDGLIADGFLVETSRTDFVLEGYGLVVKHRKLPFVSYPYEWCSEAFKEAALFFLDFNLALLKVGLMSFDVLPNNILFEGNKPIFVDLDSIRPWDTVDLDVWYEEFQLLFMRPLRLLEAGNDRIARLCMADWKGWRRGVSQSDFVLLTDQELSKRFVNAQVQGLSKRMPYRVKSLLRHAQQRLAGHARPSLAAPPASVQQISADLYALRTQVSALDVVHVPSWDYYRDLFAFPSFVDNSDWSAKHRGVARALDMAAPTSIVDIGSNRGWYAQFAASRGVPVIALDRDDNLVSLLYRDAKHEKLPLQPLVMDIVWPTPTQGLLGVWASAVDRLKCDMVMALALIHHLVHAEGMRFDQIIEGLSQFTTRWLLIEFVPYEDPHLDQWQGLFRQSWYNLENFLTSLQKSYRIVKIIESDPLQRTLILAEKATPPNRD